MTGDGSGGWSEHAPYDRVITTAAAGRLPQALVDQLAPGGRMVAPVGPRPAQDLLLVTKDAGGTVRTEPLCRVMFVEFKGKYGWDEPPSDI